MNSELRSTESPINIVEARSEHIPAIRELIAAYFVELKEEHNCEVGGFQDVEDELRELPGRYHPQKGTSLPHIHHPDNWFS